MITKIIPEAAIQQVQKLIEHHDNFAIVCHTSPDGDAIGASLGLWLFLQALEKDAIVITPDEAPASLRFLDGFKDILIYNQYPEYGNEMLAKAEVIFCLDFNDPTRLNGMSSAVMEADARRILIDHHLAPNHFCEVTISHPEIASTSELIFRLICRMGMFDLLSRETGEAIYTGMMTDTGNFTYNSNHPEMYFIIGELLRKGVDKDQIYQAVFHNNRPDKIRLNGYAEHEKMELFPTYQSALITLSREELNRFHYEKGDTEGLVNVPLSIKGITFSAFFREEGDTIKISLRSKGDFPVNAVSEKWFNGGGHKNAAGGQFIGTLAQARECFIQLLPLYESLLKD